MKLKAHIEIGSDLIKKLTAYFPSKMYKTYSPLFYEGQIPISGYLIVDGTIIIKKKNKLQKILQNGSVVGLFELINKSPSDISAEVAPNTEICFLDKSTILEFNKNTDKDAIGLLKNIFEKNHG